MNIKTSTHFSWVGECLFIMIINTVLKFIKAPQDRNFSDLTTETWPDTRRPLIDIY